MRWLYFLTFALISFLASPAFAQVIYYQGQLIDPGSPGTPDTSTGVQFKIQILSPAPNNCIMYEETQTLDLSSSNGYFSFGLNDGLGARTDSSGIPFKQIFSNSGTFNFTAGANCTGSTSYTPGPNDGRQWVMSFSTPSMGGTFDSLAAETLQQVPAAMEAYNAELIGGTPAIQVLTVATGTTTTPISSAGYANLQSLIAGTSSQYLASTATGVQLPTFAADPSAPTSGDLWYNSTNNTVEYYNGSVSTQMVAAPGGNITANNITANANLAAAGNISSNANITAGSNVSAVGGNFRTLYLSDSQSTPNVFTLTPPAAFTASYTLILPPAGPSAAGQVLTAADAAGHLVFGAVNASQIQGTNVASTVPSEAGEVLKYDGTSQYAPGYIGVLDIRSTMAGNAQFFPTTCTADQTMTYSSITDTMSCTTIALSSADVNSFAFVQNGNAFGAPAVLGTTDSNSLQFVTQSIPAMTILSNSNVGIGTAVPETALDINGALSTRGMAAPAVSPAGQGRIYFDSSSNRFMVSQNGGAFAAMAVGAALNTNGGTMAGEILGNDGTLGAPGYGFSGDPNTGIYDVSTGIIGFTTGGAEAMNISNTGMILMPNESLTMDSGTGKYSQIFTGTGPAASISDTATATGNMMNLTSSSTAANSGDSGLDIVISGANASSGVTRFGVSSTVTATGTSSTNVGGFFSASNGTTNYAIEASTSGTNNDAAVYAIETGAGNTGYAGYFNNSGTGSSSNYGIYAATASTGAGTGIYAVENGATNSGYAGFFSNSGNGINYAIKALSASTGAAYAVYGSEAGIGNTGYGGYFANSAGTGSNFGLYGTDNSTNLGVGVYAAETGTSNTGYALQVVNASAAGWGVYSSGISPNFFNGSIGIGTTAPGSALDINGAETFRGMSAPAIAPPGEGRLYFDTTANQFEISQNGGAYAVLGAGSLASGGGTMSGELVGATGSAGVPSFGFTGEPTTGFYSLAANKIGVTNGGTESMVLSSTGITGTSAFTIAATGTNQPLTLSGGVGGAVVLTPNVGIGTSTPSVPLDVVGAINTSTTFEIGHAAVISIPADGGGSIAIDGGLASSNGSAASNTAVGSSSMTANTSGNNNTATGAYSLSANSSGTNNAAFGVGALTYSTTGSYNTAVGASSMFVGDGLTGNYNTAMGYQSLDNVSGSSAGNTALGAEALDNLGANTSNNTAIGYGAGTNLTSGSNNILIGYNAQASSASANNQINIGNAIYGLSGNIGIGTNSPTYMFTVGSTGQFGVDSNGNIVGASSTATVPNSAAYAASGTGPAPGGGFASNVINPYAASGAFTGMHFQVSNSSSIQENAYIGAVSAASGYIPSIVFGSQSASNNYVERMRIDTSGNLAIGTTAANATLDVNGHIGNSNISTLPSFSCSGGSGSVTANANDTRGIVTVGAGATSCTLTFHTPYASSIPPICTVSWVGIPVSPNPLGVTTTNGNMTISFYSSVVTATGVSYICMQ